MRETTLDEGGQGGTHRADGMDKSMNPARMYEHLEWEGDLHLDVLEEP